MRDRNPLRRSALVGLAAVLVALLLLQPGVVLQQDRPATARPATVNPEITFYHHDAVGNVVAMSDEQGQAIWTAVLRPFGLGQSSDESQPLRFQDRPLERGIAAIGGLYHLGRRTYDPITGRFLQVDPARTPEGDPAHPDTFNRYAYGLNNPYRYSDVSGLAPEEVAARQKGASPVKLWDLAKWAKGTIEWSLSPLDPSGIAGLAASTVGLLAKQQGNKEVEQIADLTGNGLDLFSILRTGKTSWVGAIVMYIDAWVEVLDATEQLSQSLQDPHAFDGLGVTPDYNGYPLERLKSLCQNRNVAACYQFAARGGDVGSLDIQTPEEKAEKNKGGN